MNRKNLRKPIKKEMRLRVWEKYGRRCAYCGIELEYKAMQVDHLHPIERIHMTNQIDMVDDIENLMPSCRSCNYYKGALSLEKWRKEMVKVQERLRTGKAAFLFNLAERYGIIEVHPFGGLFYFEYFLSNNKGVNQQ